MLNEPIFSAALTSRRSLAADLAALALLTVATWAALQFAAVDRFTSFADDSVSYLIMARQFMENPTPSPLIEAVFRYERYPPLFPALLAWTGGAYDLGRAHLIVILTFMAAAVAFWLWARRALEPRWLAPTALLLFLSSPIVWPLLLRILSENLYLAFTLAAFWLSEQARGQRETAGGLLLIAVISGALLTRVTGVALVAAWGAHMLCARLGGRRPGLIGVLTLLLPLIPAILWYSSRAPVPEHHYVDGVGQQLTALLASNAPLATLLDLIAPQWQALQEAWLGALMLLWQPELNPRLLAAWAIGATALAGWLLRLRDNALDAWYLLFYLGLVVLWPFPGQVFRFVYPILPLLLLYALHAAFVASRRSSRLVRHGLPLLTVITVLALTTPALLLIHGRHGYRDDTGLDYAENPEFYQEATLEQSRARATDHLLLRQDLARIEASAREDDVIMWFEPNYLALLAHRQGVTLPLVEGREAMLEAIADDPPDYLYVSRLHPRRTAFNGLEMLQWVGGAGRPVWVSTLPDGRTPFGILFRIEPDGRTQALEQARQ